MLQPNKYFHLPNKSFFADNFLICISESKPTNFWENNTIEMLNEMNTKLVKNS